ncbi:MAG: peptide chain release factor N(5)-glutamine methyltransferase [Bacteroidota bacterium]|nr:peptide chain release factor N(5)-glutamine methyltransferase [Candidatus Kapabacteria bacterium]MCX7936816.1 peptide chain release factor N(5)-glutamine methyltransferase [Chlorobiota bacterium]MDW8270989.1 peptide chain release factor N(5)-glutamine methyltransferase [Bacteroidota bacterium]
METLVSVQRWLEDSLRKGGIEEWRREAEIILHHVSGYSKLDVLVTPDRKIDERLMLQLVEILGKRLRHRIPLQYLIGRVEFYGLQILVNPAVLIPRPETEYLVVQLIEAFRAARISPRTILDIGTGSGCIALALAKAFPTSEVVGWDISAEALEIAQQNAQFNAVNNVEFARVDIFGVVPAKRFELIVANPPYVSREDYNALAPELYHEPAIAITDGNDGLHFYRQISSLLHALTARDSVVAFECGIEQARTIVPLIPFEQVGTGRDLEGVERYVIGVQGQFGPVLRFFLCGK